MFNTMKHDRNVYVILCLPVCIIVTWSQHTHYYMATISFPQDHSNPNNSNTQLAFFCRPHTPIFVRAQFCDCRDINGTLRWRGRKTLALEHSHTIDSEIASRDHGRLSMKHKSLSPSLSSYNYVAKWSEEIKTGIREEQKRGVKRRTEGTLFGGAFLHWLGMLSLHTSTWNYDYHHRLGRKGS